MLTMQLGGTLDTISAITGEIVDPQNAEAIDLIQQIISEETAGANSGAGGMPLLPGQQTHLRDFTPYLKGFLFMRHHPWVVPVGIVLSLVGALTVAYKVGGKACRIA